ncbi:MAG TPA: UvrB/UvrC motif-containing protein, partial [Candidatus Marinimicrobia bacterium]|nr:UvrB/UvrC motif-containing protein [Candidatus Neomarinimicrobiota bacterium]
YKSTEDVLYTTAVADSFQDYDKKMGYSRKGIDFDKMDKQMAIEMMREEMLDAAHKMDYEHAAHLRDEISQLEKEVSKVFRQLKE